MRATAIIFSTLIDIYGEYIQLASTWLLHLAFTEHVKNDVVNSLTSTIHKIWAKCIPRRTAAFKGTIFISTCVSTTTINTSTFFNMMEMVAMHKNASTDKAPISATVEMDSHLRLTEQNALVRNILALITHCVYPTLY